MEARPGKPFRCRFPSHPNVAAKRPPVYRTHTPGRIETVMIGWGPGEFTWGRFDVSELESLNDQIRRCRACRLCQARGLAVPGEGPDDAEIMFVGEAPGFHEDRQGRPFVGAAGQFLEQLLASINLSRRDVYICNVIKCRPPNNREPQPDELAACRPYLDRQIELIKPKLIVTLGRFSMQLAFSGAKISRVHGIPKRVGELVYFPMFHPAAALHQPRYRASIEQDMLKIPQVLANLRSIESEESRPPQQLSLF